MDYHPELEGTLCEPIPRANILGVLMLLAIIGAAIGLAAWWLA